MQYKVYEVEAKVTPNGKHLKKLVLQGEGKQYPDKMVTMWSDHPLFGSVAVGQTIDVELDVKDSTKPNPRGGFYKNKTVLNSASKTPQNAPGAMPDGDVARVMNALNFKVLPVLEAIHGRLGLVLKALDVKVDEGKVEYPTHVETDFDEPIVTREDIPFD